MRRTGRILRQPRLLLGDRPDGADQVRPRDVAAEERRRHLHQRPDPAQRRPVLHRRGFRRHLVPQGARPGVQTHRQGRREQLHHRLVHAGHDRHRGRRTGPDPRHALHHRPRRRGRAAWPGMSVSTTSRRASGWNTTPAAPRATSGPMSRVPSAWRNSWTASRTPPSGCRRPTGRPNSSMSRTRSRCWMTR
jgi:hypothetical protein